MTTTSRPANGIGGFSDADWSTRFGAQDGIIEDYTGHALDMTLLNGSDEAQFVAAQISINGYTLTVSDGHRVSLPAPTSGSKTYYIGALYDTALNTTVPTVVDGQTVQMASALGPCRLQAYDGSIDVSDSKRVLVLYVVTRTSAALTSATVEDRRRWVGPAIDFSDGPPDASPGNEGNYPRGTLRVGTSRLMMRTLRNPADTSLSWVDPLKNGPTAFPFKSGYIARSATGNKVTYSKRAGLVKLRGDVQRSSGSFTSEQEIGYLPVGFRPDTTERFVCKTSGAGGQCEVRIDPTNGAVVVTDNGDTFSWINLSPVIFEAA